MASWYEKPAASTVAGENKVLLEQGSVSKTATIT